MATGRVPTTANSPLTAKGDLFGYSTAPARLAVGNNGESLVADSSAATGLSYQENYAAGKNKIINADFNINQRGFTSTTTSGTYGLDRWVLENADGTSTYSVQTFTPGTAPVVGYESKNFARIVTTGQTLTSAFTRLTQPIEDVRTFAGQTITVSFWAKAATGTPKIAVEAAQSMGGGGSGGANNAIGNVTISTSWARYSVTGSVAGLSGATIGTSSALLLRLFVSAGSAFNARTGSMGIQSNTFDIWGVQAEDGSVATAFQTATGTLQGELAACQRYYFRLGGNQVYQVLGGGTANGTTQCDVQTPLPVTMRVIPSSVDYSTVALQQKGGAALSAVTSVTLGLQSPSLANTSFNVASGLTDGAWHRLMTNNSTSAYLAYNAEL